MKDEARDAVRRDDEAFLIGGECRTADLRGLARELPSKKICQSDREVGS